VIHAPLHGPVAESDQTGVVPKPRLVRFLCDAVLERVLNPDNGAVLVLGQT
jgi:hypothetical protein